MPEGNSVSFHIFNNGFQFVHKLILSFAVNESLGTCDFSVEEDGAYVTYTPTGGTVPVKKKLGSTELKSLGTFSTISKTFKFDEVPFLIFAYGTTSNYASIVMFPNQYENTGTGYGYAMSITQNSDTSYTVNVANSSIGTVAVLYVEG